MKYLNKRKENLDSRKVKLFPCSEEEINKVKAIMNGNVPQCYKEFLLLMGKGMDEDETKVDYFEYGSFVGNAVFYEDLFDNKEGLQELLDEDESSLKIPENSFVFYCSQGILYAFFKLNEGDNPPVYAYSEGFEGNVFPKIADTLSEFYERYLEGYNDLFKEMYNR